MKFYLGQNEDHSSEDSLSDSSEELFQRACRGRGGGCTRSLGHVSDEVDGFPKAVEILHLFLFCNSSFIDRGYCNKFSLYFLSYDHTPVCLSDVLPFNSTNIY